MAKNNGTQATASRPIETTKRQCAVKLTPAELVARGDEMADCEIQIEILESERSELARQVKTHKKRRNELGHAVDKGTEDRELTCAWEADYPHSIWRLKRPDTGEEVDTRPMTADDLQASMFPSADEPLPAPPRLSTKRKRAAAAPAAPTDPDQPAA